LTKTYRWTAEIFLWILLFFYCSVLLLPVTIPYYAQCVQGNPIFLFWLIQNECIILYHSEE